MCFRNPACYFRAIFVSWRAMDNRTEEPVSKVESGGLIRHWFDFLKCRAFSFIVFGALFCTLGVKFFHSYRNDLLGDYLGWIPADIAVLLGIEVILSAIYFRRPRKNVFRVVTFIAALVCTWSVMNACWLIRTGTQILPCVLLPLIRSPLTSLNMVRVNLIKMPIAAVVLLGPSAIALTFFFYVLAKPLLCFVSRKQFMNRTAVLLAIILIAVVSGLFAGSRKSLPVASIGLHYNAQLKGITFFFDKSHRLTRKDLQQAKRIIPYFDQIDIELSSQKPAINHNIVVVILEGVQYRQTSLFDESNGLTPYLQSLASEGVEFTNMRSSLAHTTKVLFSIFTGLYPSSSQDLAEAVPAEKPYASLATILREKLNFRTAFFQSAKGDFEARPGLVCNLGFDKFWARDDLGEPNAFIGYLGCDEFAMLKPIRDWIDADDRPFMLAVLCSITHDPYEVPEWFAEHAKEPLQRYQQTISYTDRFIDALDVELKKMNLADKTIFCVIGDHGEAFGEHGLHGHERIAYEEILKVPWVMRVPYLVEGGTRIEQNVNSSDFTPTLLSLLGFDINSADFDGTDALSDTQSERKIYFSGWMQQGPAGFIRGNEKIIYDPANKMVTVYDLSSDPCELNGVELDGEQKQQIIDEIISWRKESIFRLRHKSGKKVLFDAWLCRWNDRVAWAKYRPEKKDNR